MKNKKGNTLGFRDYLWIIILWLILYSILMGYLLGNAAVLSSIVFSFVYIIGLLCSIIINISLAYGVKDSFAKTGFILAALSSTAFILQNYIAISMRWTQAIFSFLIVLSLALSIYRQTIGYYKAT